MSDTSMNPPRLPSPRYSAFGPGGPADGGKGGWTGEIAVGLIIRAVRRHVLLFGLIAGFVAMAAFVALDTAPVYTATAVVRLAGERQAAAAGAGVETATPELDRNSGPVLSLVLRLRSRTVAATVVDSLGL
ncbi:MAG: Wzz/FepE/Etk N-terminal domain-containing protein, partial [Gemmatimonadales bacterium]